MAAAYQQHSNSLAPAYQQHSSNIPAAYQQHSIRLPASYQQHTISIPAQSTTPGVVLLRVWILSIGSLDKKQVMRKWAKMNQKRTIPLCLYFQAVVLRKARHLKVEEALAKKYHTWCLSIEYASTPNPHKKYHIWCGTFRARLIFTGVC